jgi:hypothetical protein
MRLKAAIGQDEQQTAAAAAAAAADYPEAVVVSSDGLVQLKARAHSLQTQKHSREHNADAISQVCHKVGH